MSKKIKFESGELSPQAQAFLKKQNVELYEMNGGYYVGMFRLESRRALINAIEFSAVKALEAPPEE